MKQKGWILSVLLILGLFLWTVELGVSFLKSDTGTAGNAIVPPSGPTVTVQLTEIDDILYNPGMRSRTL